MSKVVILGDTHMCARNGSSRFSDHFNKFFADVLYPYVKKHKIKEIYQLGDLFDNRTNLSYKAFHACKNIWFDPLEELDVTMHVLLGNHDIYHKNTLNINSPELLLGEYKNIKVYNKPTQVGVFDIVPWICSENEADVTQFINRPNPSQYCLGHFEISGFSMYRGVESHGGLSSSMFDHYAMTFSGHYHSKSQQGNIMYVGTPYEITWSDYADPRGFHVLDTDTGKVTFIQNPNVMFTRVMYNNGWTGNIQDLSNKMVKVIVQEKKDLFAYDRFIDSIKLIGVHDLSIIENLDEFKEGDVDEKIDLEDSIAIINNYVDGIVTNLDKEKIKTYLQTLYNEALLET